MRKARKIVLVETWSNRSRPEGCIHSFNSNLDSLLYVVIALKADWHWRRVSSFRGLAYIRHKSQKLVSCEEDSLKDRLDEQ